MRKHWILLGIYAVLALIMTLPVIINPLHTIAGQGGDPWQTMWRFTTKAESGITGFWMDVSGKSDPQLVNLSVWPWMPIHMIFGEPLGYNVIFFLNFVLSGYAMALFIKYLTRSESILSPAPVLAGIAYMFAPYHIAHSLGHFGAMQMQWIPFIFTVALSALRSWRIWKLILLALLITIQSWEEHHYMVWLAVAGMIFCALYWKEFVATIRSHIWGVVLLGILLCIGVVVPYIPTIQLQQTDSSAITSSTDQIIRFSADLFSFITPAPWHPLWGGIAHALFGQYFTGNEAESVQYLGIPLLIVIIFFGKHTPHKQRITWISIGGIFFILSLGPVLHVFGHITSIRLPYGLIEHLPVFSAIRTIARAGSMVTFAVCVLLAWVIATNQHRKIVSFAIGVLILLDFLFIPFPTQSAVLSPAYAALATIPGKNLIEIPAATNYVAASRSLFAQTIDHKEALGNIALERGQSADVFELAKSVPALRQLLYVRTTELQQDRPEFFQQDLRESLVDSMKWLDIHAILIHTDSISASQKGVLESFLESMKVFSKTSYGDADLYTLKPDASYKTDGVLLVRGDGFEHIGYDPKRKSTFAEIPTSAAITLINVTQNSLPIELSLVVPNESPSDVAIQDTTGTTLNKIDTGTERIFSMQLKPGETILRILSMGQDRAILQNPVLSVTKL